jgi:hypothetical protein
MLGRALLTGVLAAHVAGLLLLALAIAVEAADEPLLTLAQTLVARVPPAWAQVAAVLGLVGAWAATLRLRNQGVVLGLGTLGVSPYVLLLAGALAASFGGVLASEATDSAEPVAPHAWVRGDAGWIRDGQAWPDERGGAVRPLPPIARSAVADALDAGAAGACGAAVGLFGGPVTALLAAALLLVADVVSRGLSERGALPPAGVAIPAVLALFAAVGMTVRAPLFPRRWG